MRLNSRAVSAVLAAPAAAQSTDFFNSLISDATSIYGQFTSILGDSSTQDSNTASQTSSGDSNSSSRSPVASSSNYNSQGSATSTSNPSESSASSGQSTASSAASSLSNSGNSASSAASAAITPSSSSPTSTASSASDSAGSSAHGGGVNSRTLGIILGCVFGTLLLLLLLLLFICCRRRRRRRYYISKRDRSFSSNEKGWMTGQRRRSRSPSLNELHTTPNPWDYPSPGPEPWEQDRSLIKSHEQNNPFVPVPPPPRRKPVPGHTQLSGAHELPAQDLGNEYTSSQGYTHPIPQEGNNHGALLAAGAGGLALGGLAAHAANRHSHDQPKTLREHSGRRYSETDDNVLPEAVSYPDDKHDEIMDGSEKNGLAVVGVRRNTSTGSSRARRRSWSHSRENLAMPQGSKGTTAASAAAVGVGAVAGAAAGRHRRRNSKTFLKKGILKQTASDSSNPTSTSNDYEDALTSQVPTTRSVTPGDHQSRSYDPTSTEIPPTPPFKERRQSPLGTAAPAAAAASYFNEDSSPPPKYRRYSISSSKSPTPPVPPIPVYTSVKEARRHSLPSAKQRKSLALASHPPNHFQGDSSDSSNQARGYTPNPVSPPLEPYQGDERDSLMSPVSPVTASQPGTLTQSDIARLGAPVPAASSETTSYDAPSFTSPSSGEESQTHRPRPASMPQEMFPDFIEDRGSKSIVGDNGYPHLNIPRRMSGGEYDYSETGPLGPQVVQPRSGSLTRMQQRGDHDVSSGDDSAFRLSSGIPGAWGDPSLPRRSGEMSRYPPRAYNNGARSVRSRSSSRSSRYSNPASLPGNSRRVSRPGYGFGSGDPFDLATMRTDSNMTGHSMVAPGSYPVQQRSSSRPTSVKSGREVGSSERPEQRYERLNRELDSDMDMHSYNVGRAY